MSRTAAVASLALLLAATGCSGPAPQRHVPSLYEAHGRDLCTIAVYRFHDATAAAPAAAKPGAALSRLDALPGAGTAARDAVVDLLNGNERTRDLNGMEEKASTDVPPPFRLKRMSSDPEVALRARGVDEEASPDMTPEQVREMARWSVATQVVVGEVRRVTIDLGGAQGTRVGNATVVAPPGHGVVACEVRIVLYDGATGQALLDHTWPATAAFKTSDLKNDFDKVAYGQICARRVLLNAAWRFVAEVLPHYSVDVVDMKSEKTRFVPSGPGYDDRGNPYSYLYGR